MTDLPHEHLPQPDVIDLGPAGSTTLPAQRESGTSGRKRGAIIGGGLLAVALAGGGAAYAVAALGGGGAQPDSAVPSSAMAIVTVDLDPSAGQKLDALRFARMFPDVKTALGDSDDPRKSLFKALQDENELSGDWATDVQPWLGQRGALAVLPAATAGGEPAPVVVLAITDAGKAEAGLAKVSNGKAACEVSGEFAVCAQDRAVAARAVAEAARMSLADDPTYRKDVAALGETGIASGWVDLAKMADAVPGLSGALGSGGLTSGLLGASMVGVESSGVAGGSAGAPGASPDVKGRYVVALRFDGTALDLVGRVEGTGAPQLKGTSGVGDLPAGTIAAVGTGGADTVVNEAFKQLKTTFESMGGAEGPGMVDQQVASIKEQFGITVPDDIAAALGSRAVLSLGLPDEEDMPAIALRVSGDRPTLTKLVGVVSDNAGESLPPLAQANAASDTVVASSQLYADAVAKGSGLGASKVFTDAVPDAAQAQTVIFVDIAGLVKAYGGPLDMSESDVKNVQSLSALGVSSARDGSASTFKVRLTTR